MLKAGRKQSTDPVQEKLRQNKAVWNKTVSSFVNDVIHFKKLMNGWPNKFFNEKSSLKNPIPADPATIIGSLVSDFQEIANKSNNIVQEQLAYSQNRRQRQMKQMPLPLGQTPVKQEETPEPDLSKQLSLGLTGSIKEIELIKLASEFEDKYQLETMASNPFSRFFNKLLNPGLGLSGEAARIKKYRTSLLNSTVNVYKGLKMMQKEIVASGPESIFAATKLLDAVERNYIFVASGLKSFQELLPQGAEETGGTIAPPDKSEGTQENKEKKSERAAPPTYSKEPKVLQAEKAAQDIITYHTAFPSTAMDRLYLFSQSFLTIDKKNKDLAKFLITSYQDLLATICAEKNLPLQPSLANISALSPKSAAVMQDQLQIVAQNILGKWKHKISPFDKTSAFRLDIYKVASEARKKTDQILDHLEQGLTPEALEPLLNELGNYLIQIRGAINMLNSTIRGGDYQSQFINMLDKGRLGDQYSNLGYKQKTQLEKLIEQKRMRELSKLYGR